MAYPLAGKIAVVTGASRGIGKGIALGLGEAGATVYITGRTIQAGSGPWAGSIEETAAEVTRHGGQGIPVPCDHRDDGQVESLFRQVRAEQGRLDVLVNNATALPLPADLPQGFGSFWDLHPFWEAPIAIWDQLHAVGLRSYYVASVFAAPIMTAQGSGLMVNISARGAAHYVGNVAYGVAKAGVDKLAADMASELRPFGVTAVSLWLRFTRTESIVAQPHVYANASAGVSPLYNGRAVAALASDPKIIEKTGKVLTVLELAEEYGFTDVET